MNLHEYQSRDLLSKYNIKFPAGNLGTDPDEIYEIAKKFQGRGFAKLFLSAVDLEMEKLKIKTLKVVTQGRNYSALKAYQNSKFKISKTELWYHKWLSIKN